MSNLGGRAWAWSMLLVIGALAGCIGDDADEHDHDEHDHDLGTEAMDHAVALTPVLGFEAVFAAPSTGAGNETGGNATDDGNATADGNTTEGGNATATLVTFYADIVMCVDDTDHDDAQTDGNQTEAAANGTESSGNATTPEGDGTGNETVHEDVGQQAVFADGTFTCPEGREPEGHDEATGDDAHDGNATAGDTTAGNATDGNATTGNETASHPAGPFSFVLDLGDGNQTTGTDADFPLDFSHDYNATGNFTTVLEIVFDAGSPLAGAIDLRVVAPNATDAAGPAFEPIYVVLEMVEGCELCVDGGTPATGAPGAQGCIGFQLGENELDCGWVEIPAEAWGTPFSVRSELNGALVAANGNEGSPDLEFYDTCSASGTEIYEDIDGNHDSDMADGIIPEGAGCLIVFDFHWPNLGYFVEFSIGAAIH